MDTPKTIDAFFADFASTFDRRAADLGERMPGPVGRLLRRLGAVQAEMIRQAGLFTSTTLGAARDVSTALWTGVTTMAERSEDAARDAARTARAAGREIAGDVSETADAITERAGAAADRVERRLRSVGGGVSDLAGDVENRAASGADAVSRAADASVAEVADVGSVIPGYDDWTKADLMKRAQELDIDGRSTMSKNELFAAVRTG